MRSLLCVRRRLLLANRFFTSFMHRRHASSTATVSASGIGDSVSYCRDLVRQHDYESFLISYLWPRDRQPAYFALKAFSVELATLPENITNPMIGKMRMQFWRDAVKAISEGRPPHHPIALALHEAFTVAHVAPYHLKRIIDARATEMDQPFFMSTDAFTAHAESTSSTLLYLLLAAARVSSETCAHAASHLGVAQCITTLLRALPYHASKGRMVIPAEITAKHGVNQEALFRRGGAAAGIDDAVYDFATIANDHLRTAREMMDGDRQTARAAMPVFAAGVPVSLFLERLEAVDFDVFSPRLRGREWKLPYRIWRGYHNGRF